MKKSPVVLVLVGGVLAGQGSLMPEPQAEKLLVAHRGASGYAPEHTMEGYRLAISQGADFIEPDLQITRDGILIALHDVTLDRTTNVEELFPDRAREAAAAGGAARGFYASDFTLEEIRRLDAGTWFEDRFRGARVPTFSEVIELAKASGVGIFPETKAPEVYGALGFSMERLVMDELGRHGLARRGAVPETPVYLQSFSAQSLQVLRQVGSDLHHTFLLSGGEAAEWLTPEGLGRARAFADGIGPAKNLVLADPAAVQRAHAAGLSVIPYTFSAGNPGSFPDVTAEMNHYLYEIGVDGLFTNNPDRFPRRTAGSGG
jgi:glycerophosphoryl diester phosphodiesterase